MQKEREFGVINDDHDATITIQLLEMLDFHQIKKTVLGLLYISEIVHCLTCIQGKILSNWTKVGK